MSQSLHFRRQHRGPSGPRALGQRCFSVRQVLPGVVSPLGSLIWSRLVLTGLGVAVQGKLGWKQRSQNQGQQHLSLDRRAHPRSSVVGVVITDQHRDSLWCVPESLRFSVFTLGWGPPTQRTPEVIGLCTCVDLEPTSLWSTHCGPGSALTV